MSTRCTLIVAAALGTFCLPAPAQTPLGTAFSYQGRLTDGGAPANGTHDLRFELFTADVGGLLVGSTCVDNVSVVDGLFTVELDFGAQFPNHERYLQIGVRVDSTVGNCDLGAYTTLSPRQHLTATPYALGLRLPYSASVSYPAESVLELTNLALDDGSKGIWGQSNGSGSSVAGIYGLAGGVGDTKGVWGVSGSPTGIGVMAEATATTGFNYGVWGNSYSTNGIGVRGDASADTGSAYGGYFESKSTSGVGVFGFVEAETGTTFGGSFESDSSSGRGVFGLATAGSGTNYGGYFQTESKGGTGVYGYAKATDGTNKGVYGQTDSPSGYGVFGVAAPTSGSSYGVYGESKSPDGIGVYGLHSQPIGTAPGVQGDSKAEEVEGTSTDGVTGVLGVVSSNSAGAWSAGVRAINNYTGSGGAGVVGIQYGNGYGLYGQATGATGTGVYGLATGLNILAAGVYGEATYGPGVYGHSELIGGGWFECDYPNGIGVIATATVQEGIGLLAQALGTTGTPYGVKGETDSPTGWGGYFDSLYADSISSPNKMFLIDHPLDPENKYLRHGCVESPDMKTVYDGVATLDAQGEAWVTLPDYFEALNRDLRYQLTAMGAPMPNLYVAREVADNRFEIAGGQPGGRVSWQVTGIRQDPAANHYRVEVETEKAAVHRGKYLVPEAYDQPKERGIHYRARPPAGPSPAAARPGR